MCIRDRTRAELLGKGYPQSGFAYDMYRNNAGLMTTESDKKQYTLYELQDRLGAQIRLFDGVRDAKVTDVYKRQYLYPLTISAVLADWVPAGFLLVLSQRLCYSV